ncbi:MAG: iron-containing alcohol dehydrogenase [Clostridia bacterium]|nr:iron-containing alcohol dehydrogenase [Clostridia bacterium]
MRLCDKSPADLIGKEFGCACGKIHKTPLSYVDISSGAIKKLPDVIKTHGGRNAYVIADENTLKAAGEYAVSLLDGGGICSVVHLLGVEEGFERPEPTEQTLGNLVMGYDKKCDIIVGVGGGVVNDMGKLLSKLGHIPYVYVPTAPSMDGYVSDSSSVIYNGVKSSVPSKCPDALVCDTDILAKAPKKLILAGIGDMAAKLISICEWRIGALVTGEYYCEEVAEIMRKYRRLVLDNAGAAVNGDKEAIKSIAEGLTLAGTAMTFAGVSRPASGVEHYYSHLWDMRCLCEKRQCELHGIQVGIGTLLALEKYEKLKYIKPDKKKAEKAALSFDRAEWERGVRDYFGSSADSIIKIEQREGKYSPEKVLARQKIIFGNWDRILQIVEEELIPARELCDLFIKIGHPTSAEEIGEDAETAFCHTGDIRDKYILSRLLYDIGESI